MIDGLEEHFDELFQKIYEENILTRIFSANAKVDKKKYTKVLSDKGGLFAKKRSIKNRDKVIYDLSQNGSLQWIFSPIHIRHLFKQSYYENYGEPQTEQKSALFNISKEGSSQVGMDQSLVD